MEWKIQNPNIEMRQKDCIVFLSHINSFGITVLQKVQQQHQRQQQQLQQQQQTQRQ